MRGQGWGLVHSSVPTNTVLAGGRWSRPGGHQLLAGQQGWVVDEATRVETFSGAAVTSCALIWPKEAGGGRGWWNWVRCANPRAVKEAPRAGLRVEVGAEGFHPPPQ